MNISCSICHKISEIPEGIWDQLACGRLQETSHAPDPFSTHRFLLALENSGSIGENTGWLPHYLVAKQGDLIVGLMPLFLKLHSQGEYVFDHSWAQAYERAGGQYYPKLQAAIPFTPVSGQRLYCLKGAESAAREAMLETLQKLCNVNELSSAHLTFCTDEEASTAQKMGYVTRTGLQYHWYNQDFADFDAFLGSLNARKRKQLRKERRVAQAFGGEIIALTGDEIRADHWEHFWAFYQDTGARKWGRPYLTRRFFDLMHQTMRDDILLVLALKDGAPIAGALNFIGQDALFGRYWGALEEHPCLHFELCYYQAIDFAIKHNLSRVEAGAQGDHKLARGYLPATTYSAHYIADQGFRSAVEAFLEEERRYVDHDKELLTTHSPFHQ